MHPGKMDKRITFKKESRNTDGGGGSGVAWINVDSVPTVWASVKANTGTEQLGADRLEAEAGYTFTVRNRSDINETHRIEWNGRSFNIRFVKSLGHRPLYMEIEADQGVAI